MRLLADWYAEIRGLVTDSLMIRYTHPSGSLEAICLTSFGCLHRWPWTSSRVERSVQFPEPNS